jgi:hypothetical protein
MHCVAGVINLLFHICHPSTHRGKSRTLTTE